VPLRLQIRPEAERDLDKETLYLAEQSSPEMAIRFFDAAHESFRALLDMPGMGSLRDYGSPALSGMRL
jgi:plasmid stabilization system protein ParE